ncbi:MAG: M23 family metallopeptidase, partial [Crocinitomicaceae bacterium]|nr:M23 family metallopeptidase [Crocinitomicaceae bacterium]
MKICYKSLLLLIAPALICLSVKGQVESAIELMNDTGVWASSPAHIGGAEEEEEDDAALFNEKAIDLGLWTIADSVALIPAFDTYCNWDTRNLFHIKSAKENIGCGQHFTLCRESCDFVYPVQGQITSFFGPRWGRIHYGLDIDLETGDPVSAAFEGMVRISQYHASYGNVVVIRHNSGLETVYAHLSQREVVPGDYVQAGDVVGLGGNTGRSFGSHLHFEVRYLGDAV